MAFGVDEVQVGESLLTRSVSFQMSRSTFLTTSSSFEVNETPSLATSPSSTDHTHVVRFHHRMKPTLSNVSRPNETMPMVIVQAVPSNIELTKTATPLKNSTQINPKTKRNFRGKRRSTGIRPDDVSLASSMMEV
jgi:hypothetical protein